MKTKLASHLELTPGEARAQWRRIAMRQPRERQERYTPVEVLLCYGLFFVVDPHSLGGGNIHEAPESLHRLASLFQRSPNSLSQKMLNLDGSRVNAARAEPELFIRLSADPGLFFFLYDVVRSAAKDVGLNVPDFVRESAGGQAGLLGQEEIGHREMEIALSEEDKLRSDLGEEYGFNPHETERLVEQRVRLGQHRFASAVLRNYGGSCAFCGFAPHHLAGCRMLTASHIKPWRDSAATERLDPANGIAACPTHDAAFDTGLLGLDDELRILASPRLLTSIERDPEVARWFGPSLLGSTLRVLPSAKAPLPAYLAHHRAAVFKAA